MNNHSNIWQNITMIIFFIFLPMVLFILLIKLKVNINLEVNGTKSQIKVKFLFWELKRKGAFLLKKKYLRYSSKRLKFSPNFANDVVINDTKFKINKDQKIYYIVEKEGKKNIYKRIYDKIGFDNFLLILKSVKFEKIEINEKIGFIDPSLTAYSIPIISIITMLPINVFNINLNNFRYKIIPEYTDLKFEIKFKAEISFRILKIIFCIIKEKLHKLILKRGGRF